MYGFRVCWKMHSLLLKIYWRLRTICFGVYWFSRNIALKTFWRLRAVGYRVYWALRSYPSRLKVVMRDLFYKYLNKYKAFKVLRSWLREVEDQIFILRTRVVHGVKGRSYALIPLSSFIVRSEIKSFNVDSGGCLDIKGPRFIGEYKFKLTSDEIVKLRMPKLEIASLGQAVVIGGTNFVRLGDQVIHPNEYIPERDVCPAELSGVAKFDLGSKTISIYSGREKHLKEGVSLLGSCTGNYAHWLTETLPKLLIVDSISEFNDYPLLVDDWIHPNFVDSIAMLNKNGREIIRVRRWEAITVKSLVEVSAPAYFPPEDRHFLKTKKLGAPRSGDFSFSKTALDMLRGACHKSAGVTTAESSSNIYLYRSRESCGNSRQVVNIEEGEQLGAHSHRIEFDRQASR